MKQRLPPLNALRAFEAAGRHQSFTLAAEELHVTQGAVSRHVKLLEEHLGVVLFRRLARGLELTEQGRSFLPEVSESFQRLASAARKLSTQDHDLRIIAPPSVAIRWLVPRIHKFQARYPDIRVRMSTELYDYDGILRGDYDLGLDCFDQDRPDALDAILIMSEALTPVCAPSLLEGPNPLREPNDLSDHVLLHPTEDHRDWQRWVDFAGADQVDPTQGQSFGTLDLAVRAAASGLGVAIGDLGLIRNELETGQVVAPFDQVLREGTGYLLIALKGRFKEPKIAAFRDWLLEEAKADVEGEPNATAARM